jgi:hypothetical protein
MQYNFEEEKDRTTSHNLGSSYSTFVELITDLSKVNFK